MTFPSNVHFEAELASSPKLHDVEGKKKKVWYSLSITSTPSLSCSPLFYLSESHFHAFSPALSLFPFNDPRVLLRNLNNARSLVPPSVSPSLSPSPPRPHLLPVTLLLTCYPLFLISDFLCDWKISIILESLHKSLPSHFLAEMAFLLICTVCDHMEHSLHTSMQ